MRLTLRLFSASVLVPLLAPSLALAAPWEDATMPTIGKTAEWSNKVELADFDGDGLVDILFANGAGYNTPEGPEQSRVFLNKGAGKAFVDVSADIFPQTGQTRVIKVRDVTNDGIADIVVGNGFETQSWLFIGTGKGAFTDATAKLPQQAASIGDLELGDVDGDGDLDIVLADWGPGPAQSSGGAVTKLWLGDGAGNFTDATASNMPNVKVGWSWEMDLADVDNDYDLDVLVSCKACDGSYLFHNDGNGIFTDASDQMPQFANNYDFEAIDLNGDDFVDLITVNDGPMFREHILLGDGMGGFEDATAELWPDAENISGDDNMVAFLDFESDGDADFVICGLFGNDDRLLINDGAGNLTVDEAAFAPANSSGSLGIAVADLNGDKKIDVVFSEGESPQNADRVFLGADVAVDTAVPKISLVDITSVGTVVSARARVHDNKTPVMPHDFTEVALELTGDGVESSYPMTWYGEALWRVEVDFSGTEFEVASVCATDAAGNRACSEGVSIVTGEDTTTGDDTDGTTGGGTATTEAPTSGAPTTSETETGAPTTGATATSNTPTSDSAASDGTTQDTSNDGSDDGTASEGLDDDGGCGCRSEPVGGGAWLLALGGLLLARRRRA